MKRNVRIQLFDKEEKMISDRLISQVTEFYQGPKEKHKGPIRIEFSLGDRKEVEAAVKYLGELALDLPLKSETRGKKSSTSMNSTEAHNNQLEDVITSLAVNSKDQDSFIKELRKEGFVFLTSNFLTEKLPSAYNIKNIHLKNYQWLIKKTKVAKDPRNDKYDPRAIVGIKILSKRSDKMVFYVNGKKTDYLNIKVPKKAMGFRKTNLIKYPHYMLHDERVKWGLEHRVLLMKPEKKPSKFYVRWMKDIEVGDELKLPKK